MHDSKSVMINPRPLKCLVSAYAAIALNTTFAPMASAETITLLARYRANGM